MGTASGSGRGIYDELQVRIIIGLKACMGKPQHAPFGVSQALYAACAASNIVRFPPFCKLRAAVSKTGQQLDECRIAGPEIVCRTKLGDNTLGLLGPAWSKQPARSRIEQDADENVAIFFRKTIEGKDVRGDPVPGKDIPASARDVSRLIEGLDKASKGCGNGFSSEGAPIGTRCQRPQMRMLYFTEAQRSCQCIDGGD